MTQAATNNPGTSTSDLMVEMRDVNKWYGDFHVLRDINLEVKRGERIVICGPSGRRAAFTQRWIAKLPSGKLNQIIYIIFISIIYYHLDPSPSLGPRWELHYLRR